LRHPGLAILSTIAAVIFALAAAISPANAALRSSGSSAGSASVHVAGWPSPLTFGAAVALLAVTWAASTLAASTLAAAYRTSRP
jgi:hypothetical protein